MSVLGGRLARSWSLARVLARREFRVRYRQSVLEVGWSLATPIATLVVYGLVLTYAFEVDTGPLPFLSTVWIGLVVWTTFSTAVGGGVTSIVANGDLVSKIYFPREVLPLAVFGTSLFDLGIGVAVLVPLLAVQIQAVSLTAVAALPVLAVLLLWTAAVAVWVAVVAVFVRDVVHVVRLALLIGFFATPVMYVTSGLPRAFVVAARLNPVGACIEALRDVLLARTWPEWGVLGGHAVAGTLLLAAAIAATRAVEDRMVDVL